METGYSVLLFLITLIGSTIPLFIKGFDDKRMLSLLAFSGSFLLSITFLHLLPETFGELNARAGVYILIGFFLQLALQRLTHGIEHGHVHHSSDHHHVPVISVIAGLTLHAVMEGLPLGFNYRMASTTPSLYLAVAAHKLPESVLAAMLINSVKGKKVAFITMCFFSLVTPLSGMLANKLGTSYHAMSNAITVVIPIVAGAFIHIATTIFFESGTKNHLLTWQKLAAMLAGVGAALTTLLF
ncbi:MAG: ZIP family metal transporter [Bacteroidetes bacterium]|nr:ZIP family metal transporter [Bacteroidota bacterium]